MCGIAGLFAYDTSSSSVSLDADLGLQMVDALTHRGPDDGGLLVATNILLGHRRLSILDLSENGHQPMADDDSQCWIAFNGEIYNFKELRAELESSGHQFQSQTDTEVILRGYRQWGHDVAKRLNGMFAFVIWDRRDGSLWLVRDLIGIKPLFFRDDGQRLWFGSEIKAILADSAVPRKPDWPGLDAFLTFGYTPAPDTGFDGIKQLQPGESLLAKAGCITKNRWSQLPYPDAPTNWNAQECAERLGTAIDDSVRRQMISDVPLGALLSGGLDSSAVVRSMRRAGDAAIETFTIGFADASFDESPFAARVAQIYGTNHHVDQVEADVIALLHTLVSHAEEPFADNSMIPFYLLSQQVRQNVTVALSGDGADELLAGYDTYRASQLAPYYRMIPGLLRRGVIAPLAGRLPTSTRKYSLPSLLRRFVAAAEQRPPRDHCSWRRFIPLDLRQRLYTDQFKRHADGDPIGQYAGTLEDAPDWLSPLQQQLHIDLRFHLPSDMLVKADRMSMAHALEVRVPLLDNDVLRTCLAMPSAQKRRGKRGKLPLRRLLESDLPTDLIHRKKAGFLSPIERWLQGPWQPLLRDLLTEEFAAHTGAFHWPVLSKMIDDQASQRTDHAYPLFALLILSIWWKTWIDGDWPPDLHCGTARPTKVHHFD